MNKDITIDLLKFIYITQYPSKKLMRSLGNSYDFTGRKIRQLINDGYLLETKIGSAKTLAITKKGLTYLQKEYKISKELDKKLRVKTKGEKNKIRQSKLAMSLQMLNKYVPNYIDDYISFENKINANENILIQTARQDKIERIRNEIYEREQRSLNFKKCWFMTFREIRELDKSKLKNITSTRTNGIYHTPIGDFAIYNHYKKRMRCYGNFERVFYQFAEEICDKELDGAIHFGSSFQVLLDTILKTPDSQLDNYILSSLIYKKQFYVPLTSDGIKQLQIYNINNFRQKACNALIKKEHIRNAETLIIDGYSENEIFYLGFECNYNEIDGLYKNIENMFSDKEITIYCFPHQSYFYEQLFGKYNAKIKMIEIDKMLSVFQTSKGV